MVWGSGATSPLLWFAKGHDPGLMETLSRLRNSWTHIQKKAVDAFRKGLEYRIQKKNEDAMKTFEMAIHVAPGFYQAHNQLGILYKEVGRNDDAENETYIAENPRGEQLKDVIEMRDQLLKAKETGRP